MIRQAIEKISEGKNVTAVFKKTGSYDDVMDFLDANGGYESVDQWAKGNFGYKSNYDQKNGSVYILTPSEFKKFAKAVKEIGELEEIDGNVDFGKIYSKKAFDSLDDKAKLAVVYYWLAGKTDIQPSNINDLVVSVTSKKAVFTSNSTTVDVGDKSISGMEELPFDMKFTELKKIVKEVL